MFRRQPKLYFTENGQTSRPVEICDALRGAPRVAGRGGRPPARPRVGRADGGDGGQNRRRPDQSFPITARADISSPLGFIKICQPVARRNSGNGCGNFPK
ncbi:hypothetical protein EVAR_26627_1 [Eumeta japonica]|uniref:Uncharacterized protein n=1 Tax=Eumeta variegata TaxID=151549 RepID=A0A4C1XJG3_EUMVA|nr:hypothetical protein EVAR_26627_1 [Eumeta japonica]